MIFKFRTFFVIVFAFFLLSCTDGWSQERIEAGFFLGGSYYNGDLNPGKQFYSIQPSFGGVFRVVSNSRIAFKGTFTIVNIQGDYPGEDIQYPSVSGNSSPQYSFERTMADMAAQIEINFFEYDHPFRRDETRFSPYITAGIASTFYRRYYSDAGGSSENPHFILSLPFGIGIKWKLSDWVHLGLEWNFRKTFVDDLDKMGRGAIDPSDPYGFDQPYSLHNNDWYSFAGVLVTFDLFHRKVSCNAGY
ncbi:MAG: hypothetical protein PWQ06_614 [Anaerophaga sp.]|nr:hypothetical protein [Anaerophaga sp.]MDN5290375.1 hypothetical protein [Anaerophaga sp.]